MRIVTIAAALALAGCATLDAQMPIEGTIVESGMVCTVLQDAERHEALRTKKDATPYEVAQAMAAPECVLISRIGREVWVERNTAAPMLHIRPTGSASAWVWAPRRMVQLN